MATHTEFSSRESVFVLSEIAARSGGGAIAESVGDHLGRGLREIYASEVLGYDVDPGVPSRIVSRTPLFNGLF